MDIEPGAPLSIEVIATPKRVAARKTLERVCAKDPAVAKRHRVQKAKRPSRHLGKRRASRPSSQDPCEGSRDGGFFVSGSSRLHARKGVLPWSNQQNRLT